MNKKHIFDLNLFNYVSILFHLKVIIKIKILLRKSTGNFNSVTPNH